MNPVNKKERRQEEKKEKERKVPKSNENKSLQINPVESYPPNTTMLLLPSSSNTAVWPYLLNEKISKKKQEKKE